MYSALNTSKALCQSHFEPISVHKLKIDVMWKIHCQFNSYFNTQQEADLLSINLMYKQQINFTADTAAGEESTAFTLRESIICIMLG